MAESTMMTTFAELAFLLRSTPDAATLVLDAVRVRADVLSDVVAAAGLASLLARDLCRIEGDQVVSADLTAAVTGSLVRSASVVSVANWVGTSAVTAHVFSGLEARVALYPQSYGLFRAELLDPGEDLADVLERFLDEYVAGGPDSAVLFRSGPNALVDLVAVVDGSGAWHLSDSVATPDRAVVSSRDAVAARVRELYGTSYVSAGR